MKRTALWLTVLALGLSGLAWADDDDAGRGVARISLIGGDVSVRRGDSGDWVAAAMNAPLVSEDTVGTGPSSRAEVQFDWANMIRMGSNSEIRLAQLENQHYVIQIARGTVTFRVLRDSDANVELSTPNVSVHPNQLGIYRISVSEDGDSMITVRSGDAEVYTSTGSERLGPGSTMEARGSASDPEYRIVAEIPQDSWDNWNLSRDNQLEQSKSYQYADRSEYGVEDLDNYGTWVDVADYGYVWRPRVDVGWSPYYYGRWSWVDWYGWTWVSYDPWGWAPYHYGRWFWDVGFGWCWWPGGHMRHHWSPALVAFFGYGGGGIGFGYGRVGWVPLAPHEPFHPWYGRGYYGGFRNAGGPGRGFALTRDFDVRRNYRNARVGNGAVGMDAGAFGRGHGQVGRIHGDDMNRAGLVRGMLPVTPGRDSLRMSNRDVNRASLPKDMTGRTFAGRTQVRQTERVSFEDQRRGTEQMVRRGSSDQAAGSFRGGAQGVTIRNEEHNMNRSQDMRSGDSGRWRQSGEAARTQPESRQSDNNALRGKSSDSNRDQGTSRDRWQRFETNGRQDAGQGRSTNRGRVDQRFQSSPSQGTAGRDNSLSRTESRQGWSRFEGRGDSARQQSYRGNSEAQRGGFEAQRQYQSERAERYNTERSLRISQPIIRQRESRAESGGGFGSPRATSPRYSDGGSRGNFGAMRSAPSYGGGGSRMQSAPQRSGGGGGGRMSAGQQRSSGGGGGGRGRGR